MSGVCFARIGGGNAGKSHRGNPKKFAHQCHGVGSELPAAGTGPGTGSAFKRPELSVRHSTARVLADRFVNILNRHGVTLELAWRDRAAIQNKSGNIETRQGHHGAGNRFIAAHEDNQCVEEISSCDQLDRIGDDLAAYQGRSHAFRAHGDAIGNGDRVELQRSSTGGTNAFLHMLREFTEVIVAGTDFDPGIGHADERSREVIILEAGGAKHGACTHAVRAVG